MEYFDQLIIGCCYLAIVIVAILLNLLLTYIVLTTKDFIHNSSFKLLVEFNVTLLLLCCVHVLTSLKTILQVDFNDIGERLIGAITNFAWMAAMALNLVIAADRFHVVVFSKHNSKKKWILFVVSVLAWLPGCILFAVDLTPNTGYVFSIVESNWIYLEGPWTAFAQTFEQCVTFPSLTGSFVLYVLIFVYIAKQKLRAKSFSLGESRILIISAVGFFYIFSEECVYQFGSDWVESNEIANLVVNSLYTSYPFLCQIIHVVFNKKMRKLAKNKLGLRTNVAKKMSTSSPVLQLAVRGTSRHGISGTGC